LDELRRLRKLKGLSQVELAERSGVSAYTITEIETGHREPRPSTLRKLASALDAEVADFFPKAQAPSRNPRDGALLGMSFNMRTVEILGGTIEGMSDQQRLRERIYGPWRDFVNTLLDRWEAKIAKGIFDRSSADEFSDTLAELAPRLGEMEAFELTDTPSGERGSEEKTTAT
jgi:transcriptional regulator with XRE-family HTH domain